jgi:hypothetical protein
MGGNSPLSSYEDAVKRAEAYLESRLRDRETAKKNGNYKNASKNINCGGKTMNAYDSNVYFAKEEIKKAKARLAEAKKRYR